MARVTVYLPDGLAADAREIGINVSAVTQDALRSAVTMHRHNAWLDRVLARRKPTGVTHEMVLRALDEGRGQDGMTGDELEAAGIPYLDGS